MKKVLISGFAGQDGANMTEFLLKNTDCQIFGMVRRSATPNYKNVQEFLNNPRVRLVFADLTDPVSLNKLVQDIQPDYFINLGANSFVGCSWDMPVQVFETNTLGVLHGLEAIRKYQPNCRYYSAGSSEEFGDVLYSPQDIKHPLRPRSPYGASKCAARHLVKVYRESYGLYAVHGILFNHEGIKRGEEFVTRKISKGVGKIYAQLKEGKPVTPIELGNLDSKRDWSDSEDFVEGIWMMLNQEQFINLPWDIYVDEREQTKYLSTRIQEYVLASGETHTIREFVELAFKAAGIDGVWINGQKFDEKYDPQKDVFAYKQSNGAYPILVRVNPKFYRPAEVDLLVGDSTPIRQELGWKPKTTFPELVKKMVEHDLCKW